MQLSYTQPENIKQRMLGLPADLWDIVDAIVAQSRRAGQSEANHHSALFCLVTVGLKAILSAEEEAAGDEGINEDEEPVIIVNGEDAAPAIILDDAPDEQPRKRFKKTYGDDDAAVS